MTRALPVAVLLGVIASTAASQELLWERIGVTDRTKFGGRAEAIGDVDGDGWTDLMHQVCAVVGTPCDWQCQLWILSGKDGSTLRTRPTVGPLRIFWTFTAAGDVDGDGKPDYATMIGDQSHLSRDNIVEVRSAVDDRLLWSVTEKFGSGFGLALLGDLDLDGDRRPDLVVTACCGAPHGEVRAYSSKGRLLYRLPGTASLAIGIWQNDGTLGKVGDVDGDGADDFVVGGIRQVPSGFGGSAVLVSGKTGKVLQVGAGPTAIDSIGHSVAGVGDVDGDGTPDFAGGTSKNNGGIVRVFSGKSGQPIWTWRGVYPRSNWGWSVAGSGVDVDRDGVPDVIAGGSQTGESNPLPTGVVRVMSGRDGAVIKTIVPDSASTTYIGDHVAMIPAQPGSPFPLFAVSEPGYDGINGCLNAHGRLRVYRGSPAGVSAYGLPCAGTLATIPKAGVRDLGARGARFTVYGAAPSSPAVLLVGLSRTMWGGNQLPIPLYPVGMPGCLLFTSVEVALLTTADGNGYASLQIPLPLSASGRVTLHGQWWSAGTGPAAPGGVSDALMWTVR